MEQEKKPVKQRFNIIDALLIIILAVLAVMIFFTIKDKRIVGNTTADAEILIEFESDPVYENLKSLAEVGRNTYDVKTGDRIGEITDVSYSDYFLEGISDSGERVRTRVPGMSVVSITLRAEVRKTGTGYLLNGSMVTVNDIITLRTRSFSCTGRIIGIRSEESGEN